MSEFQGLRAYVAVTAAYWAFMLTDGALRMLVLLHFHTLGYSPLQLAYLFLFYEVMGVATNLSAGGLASRFGLPASSDYGATIRLTNDNRLFVRNLFNFNPNSPTPAPRVCEIGKLHRKGMLNRWPGLKDVGFAHSWGGTMALIWNDGAVFGEFAPGLYAVLTNDVSPMARGAAAGGDCWPISWKAMTANFSVFKWHFPLPAVCLTAPSWTSASRFGAVCCMHRPERKFDLRSLNVTPVLSPVPQATPRPLPEAAETTCPASEHRNLECHEHILQPVLQHGELTLCKVRRNHVVQCHNSGKKHVKCSLLHMLQRGANDGK